MVHEIAVHFLREMIVQLETRLSQHSTVELHIFSISCSPNFKSPNERQLQGRQATRHFFKTGISLDLQILGNFWDNVSISHCASSFWIFYSKNRTYCGFNTFVIALLQYSLLVYAQRNVVATLDFVTRNQV